MSAYNDRFINHPLHENLRNIRNRIESLISENSESEGIEHWEGNTDATT
jgi:hypothetical protein